MSTADLPQEVWDHEIKTIEKPAADWIWHGFVAGGNTTLLTGMPKAGKTTLVSLLLSRRKEGGMLAGLTVKPGKTVIVTEEDSVLWAERARFQEFGGQVCFLVRPFLTIPSMEQWQGLLGRIVQLRERHGIDMAVIDPMADFFQSENNATNVLNTMLPLRALTRLGMGMVCVHHPAKGPRPAGLAARGSTALVGHVDISIEMRFPGGDPLTRQRRFLALSRHAQTPRQLLLELNPEGTDYVLVAANDEYEDQFQANWHVLQLILNQASRKLTRLQILDEWPPDNDDKPHKSTLSRWLARAVERKLIAGEGSGTKNDPMRYWLPEREAVWKQDPLYRLMEQQRKDDEMLRRTMDPNWKSAEWLRGA